MEKITFTKMADGTRQEYEFLNDIYRQNSAHAPDRLLQYFATTGQEDEGYLITRFDHSLQSASRAFADSRDAEYVVACLFHDIGDSFAPYNHSAFAAAILRPYISPKMHWIILHHGLFQGYYYNHHLGGDRNLRDKFIDHEYYHDCVEFCEKYDQNCFDPEYISHKLDFFVPLVHQVMAKPINFL